MTTADFRRIALSFPGSVEGSHMGVADFRFAGSTFATLAAEKQGYGNLMLTPEIQTQFITDSPELYLPVKGGWGRMGITHIVLVAADESTLTGALQTAYRLRVEKSKKKKTPSKRKPANSL